MDALLAGSLGVCLAAAGCAAAGELDSQIKARTAGFQGTISVYAKNLDTGASYSLRGDERVRTASTIKLAILSEVYAEAADGRLNLDETVELKAPMKVQGAGILQDLSNGDRLPLRDIVLLMIVLSDNTATNLVLDRIGGDAVNARMEALGLKQTRVLGKIGGGGQTKASQDPVNKGFGIGVTTPHEMAELIAKLAASPEMVTILKKQRYKDGIGRRLTYEVASKSGALDALRSDVGIVYTPKGRIAIAATVDDMPKVDYSDDNVGNILIADLTKILVAGLVD
jgi:beta-lactamase class A